MKFNEQAYIELFGENHTIDFEFDISIKRILLGMKKLDDAHFMNAVFTILLDRQNAFDELEDWQKRKIKDAMDLLYDAYFNHTPKESK